MAKDGNVESDDGVSVLLNEEVVALIADTGIDLHRRRDDRLGDAMDLVSATLTVSLSQLIFPNCFGIEFGFPSCKCSALPFWISRCDCALKAIS